MIFYPLGNLSLYRDLLISIHHDFHLLTVYIMYIFFISCDVQIFSKNILLGVFCFAFIFSLIKVSSFLTILIGCSINKLKLIFL